MPISGGNSARVATLLSLFVASSPLVARVRHASTVKMPHRVENDHRTRNGRAIRTNKEPLAFGGANQLVAAV